MCVPLRVSEGMTLLSICELKTCVCVCAWKTNLASLRIIFLDGPEIF